MKKFSLEDFMDLLSQSGWTHIQEHEFFDGLFDNYADAVAAAKAAEAVDGVTYQSGQVVKTSTLGDIRIIHTEDFTFTGYDSDSLSIIECVDQPDVLEGAVIVDSDGMEINFNSDIAPFINGEFFEIDPQPLINELNTPEDIDTVEGSEKTTLFIDNEPNIRFTGERIGFVSSETNSSLRWKEFSLYKTVSGKFVCWECGCSNYGNETTRYKGKVCTNEEEVIAFFGHSRLAKELYEDVGFDAAKDVE